MRHPIFTATAVCLALTLAACQKQPPVVPVHAFVKKGVSMSLYPPAAPDCKPTTTYVATLTWTVDVSVTSKTEVRIGKPDAGPFARSNDQKSSKDTGKWVTPGAWFLLFDRRSGEMIGALQAGPTPCP